MGKTIDKASKTDLGSCVFCGEKRQKIDNPLDWFMIWGKNEGDIHKSCYKQLCDEDYELSAFETNSIDLAQEELENNLREEYWYDRY